MCCIGVLYACAYWNVQPHYCLELWAWNSYCLASISYWIQQLLANSRKEASICLHVQGGIEFGDNLQSVSVFMWAKHWRSHFRSKRWRAEFCHLVLFQKQGHILLPRSSRTYVSHTPTQLAHLPYLKPLLSEMVLSSMLSEYSIYSVLAHKNLGNIQFPKICQCQAAFYMFLDIPGGLQWLLQ